MIRHFMSLALSIAAASPVAAATIGIEIPPESVSIDFTLKATLHTVRGTAPLEQASFTLDAATGALSGLASINAAAVDTGHKGRDKKMHAKVLRSADHPAIVFRAERFEGELAPSGSSDGVIIGTLELLSVAHPIRLPVTVSVDGATAQIEAAFTVPYVEWGLTDPSNLVLKVGKEVPVTIRAEATLIAEALDPPTPTDG